MYTVIALQNNHYTVSYGYTWLPIVFIIFSFNHTSNSLFGFLTLVKSAHLLRYLSL